MAERYVDIDRRTPMLLPVDLREWVAKDTLARLIIDAIEQCDLRRAVTNDRGSGSPQISARDDGELTDLCLCPWSVFFPAHRGTKLRKSLGPLLVRQYPS